jgi:plastocyanin
MRHLLAILVGITVLAGTVPLSAQTGRIEGVASISRRLTVVHRRIRVYDEPGTTAARAERDENPFANVVIYLESVPVAGARAAAAPAMRQRGESFMPHVLPVLAGSTVQFPNDDPIYHNVFSLSRARTFDLGRYARGSSKGVGFPSPSLIQVFCHIHADMSGFILVLQNPYFVQPDSQGRFTLEGVPPGTYLLVAWHERIRPNVTTVRVNAGEATRVSVSIPISDPP